MKFNSKFVKLYSFIYLTHVETLLENMPELLIGITRRIILQKNYSSYSPVLVFFFLRKSCPLFYFSNSHKKI